nr:FKBP-type peptidyl-prolyl cis-trans isomerase N-terminal domain-containing protein [Gammaproteobacteria bacterium]
MARTTGRAALNCLRQLVIAAGVTLASLISSALAQDPSADADEVLYYWGTVVGEQLRSAGISEPGEIEAIVRGLQDHAAGKAPEFGDEYRAKLNDFLVARSQQAAAAEAIESGKYVALMAEETGATKTSSGLVFRELRAGDGA